MNSSEHYRVCYKRNQKPPLCNTNLNILTTAGSTKHSRGGTYRGTVLKPLLKCVCVCVCVYVCVSCCVYLLECVYSCVWMFIHTLFGGITILHVSKYHR